ncbi:hypothetical protein [Methyloferula stellata]|uniref:COG3904 family protein n=1 Tax=Methyloferula stellata TaxID=876270 RepID=UPI00036EED17|nr:hypothetical protein [Methyloferula stellata]
MGSFAILAVILFSYGVSAYRDLSRPEAWAYWRDLYFSPGLTSTIVSDAYTDSAGHLHPGLAVSGKIGAAAASWFRDRIEEAHLSPGDAVFLSSPGGYIDQALIIGEVIRSKGLVTAVGVPDSSGHIKPSYCASACVFAYAGGTVRIGIPGSKLGVHRFTTTSTGGDPVADTQRTTGIVLGYMTKMGVSSAVVEAMSATNDIHWLSAKETTETGLVTDPLGSGG